MPGAVVPAHTASVKHAVSAQANEAAKVISEVTSRAPISGFVTSVPPRFRIATPTVVREEAENAEVLIAPGAQPETAVRQPAMPVAPTTANPNADAQPHEQGGHLHREAAWAERMMTRIEEARDAVDATDRRIRITPDALGAVEVHVRRDGEAVQIQLSAEHAGTRALLADAAPRMTEVVGGRSLQFTGGEANAGSGHRPAPEPAQHFTPARRANGGEATLTTTDHRIA